VANSAARGRGILAERATLKVCARRGGHRADDKATTHHQAISSTPRDSGASVTVRLGADRDRAGGAGDDAPAAIGAEVKPRPPSGGVFVMTTFHRLPLRTPFPLCMTLRPLWPPLLLGLGFNGFAGFDRSSSKLIR
jgi:hypothetical protein